MADGTKMKYYTRKYQEQSLRKLATTNAEKARDAVMAGQLATITGPAAGVIAGGILGAAAKDGVRKGVSEILEHRAAPAALMAAGGLAAGAAGTLMGAPGMLAYQHLAGAPTPSGAALAAALTAGVPAAAGAILTKNKSVATAAALATAAAAAAGYTYGGAFVDDHAEKKAHFMLNDKFPIESWEQVKTAERYLEDDWPRMDMGVRRECAVKLAARAEELQYDLNPMIKAAGAETYADYAWREQAIGMRKQVGADDGLDILLEKSASISPNDYAETLRRYDIDQGIDQLWGSRVPNPYESTFGLQKTASVIWEEAGERLTDSALNNLAHNRLDLVEKQFSLAMAGEFRKDPKGIFKSLPRPEKMILARMAAEASSDGGSDGVGV